MGKNARAQDNPAQSKRFLELAKEIEADADEEALAGSVKRLGAHQPEPRRKLGKGQKKRR
jgi:hypothetical protein